MMEGFELKPKKYIYFSLEREKYIYSSEPHI